MCSKCYICSWYGPKGNCLRKKRDEECTFVPEDSRVFEYAETRGISVIEAIELWKWRLECEAKYL